MNKQWGKLETIRPATWQDVPFLARMDLEASRVPFKQSFWEELLEPVGTPPPRFLETVLRCGASQWGQIEDFLVIERSGQPVATCAVFRPSGMLGTDSPFNIGKLPEIAEVLRWDAATSRDFKQAYAKVWGGDNAFLKPQAEMIVETVAVSPEHRGSGLGHSLMRAAFECAREAGAASLGIMVIHGNKPAQSLYEKYFEPFATFHPAFFDYTFPGLTKYRANLNP